MTETRTLFKALKVGNVELQHRIAMAPLTRFRARDDHVHSDLAIEYYTQRATPGGLLITEATFILPQASGYRNVPGCYSPEQIKAWAKIVKGVHGKAGIIFQQLWALGRAAQGKVLKEEGGYDVVSSSDVPLDPNGNTSSKDKPRPLTKDEIKGYIAGYAQCAKNFVQGAGGDGVELHFANGYLVDQFTQTNSNKRTDEYGGSVENRCRFAREIIKAVVEAVDMKMPEKDMIETFSYLTKTLKKDHPGLAYLHVTLPRVAGGFSNDNLKEEENIDFIHDIWAPLPIIIAGQYEPETAIAGAEKYPNSIIAFGRMFISNPDLPYKVRYGAELTPYNRKTFYLYGPDKAEGYTTYKTSKIWGKL
ncbi:BQ2448_1175 [Microbotryum intermedium]|uniref:BQ2448_1175 protein n=1 Tax=Microbotryum intermedium TaxID=269621 RepID=A0A238FCE2_9BASI|nr:BQ2448_1175 [Microbotryum intermedium]